MDGLEILTVGYTDYGKSSTLGVQVLFHVLFIVIDVFTQNFDKQDIWKTR